MTRLIICFFLFISLESSAQGIRYKLYLNAMLRETVASLAVYTLDLTATEDGLFEGVITDKSNIVKARGGYIKEIKEFKEHGYFVFFYSNGTIESEGNFEYGIKVGNWKRFAEDGTQKPDRYYNPQSAEIIRNAMTGNLPK